VEHQGSRYLGQWGTPEPVHVVEALRVAAEVRADEAEARAAASEVRAAASEARANAADASAAALADTTAAAEARALTAEHLLVETRASRSWQLTAPLRRLADLARRIR